MEKKVLLLIKNMVNRVLNESKNSVLIKEIKYFSNDGNNKLPNGHPFQKGWYLKECLDNSNKFKKYNNQYLIKENFELVEAIHNKQYSLYDYRGGIIVFSTDINSKTLNPNKILNWFESKGKTYLNRFFSKSKINNLVTKFNDDKGEKKMLGDEEITDYIGAFSIGNFFSGRYLDDNGDIFDEKSLSLEINGMSSKGLIYFAELIAKEFNQETVLVKDLNINKIFLVNPHKGSDYDLSNINTKVS
jgi:hypothetical protein